MTALAKPAVGQTVVDPQFGTTIRRISASGGTGAVIKPAYGTIAAWNADETYLVLYHTGGGVAKGQGHHLYNGKTYSYIKQLTIDPPDLEQFYWDTSDPDLLYVIEAKKLMRVHISTGVKDALHTFTCDANGGADPMFTSWASDKKILGLRCGNQIFSYNLATGAENTKVTMAGYEAPVAAASGSLLFYSNAGKAEVRDQNMNFLRTLPVNSEEHASLGRLASGIDTHNAVSFDGSYVGTLVTSDMSTGSARVVIGPDTGYPYPPTGTHVSALSYKNPGWVSVSVVGNTKGAGLLDQEMILANTNPGGKTCRVAHHRSFGKEGTSDYWAEPHSVLSPSGTRILFGSDWGNGGSVDAYVLELPAFKR
jgi:hypothetical protein